MGGRIYLLQDDGELLEMGEEPYDSEDRLQALLADHPSLMVGEQVDPKSPGALATHLQRGRCPVP